MSRVMLITANVGSVFENIDPGLPVWLNELTQKVKSENPHFLALHFQETGGKDYKNESNVIQTFFSVLIESLASAGYNLLEGIVDSEAHIKPEYTALSCLYFIHQTSTTPVAVWDFGIKKFIPLNPSSTVGKLLIGKDLQVNTWNQKEKFPQRFFPNHKWSRKGFARSRWRLGTTVVDLVNIHLFHDSHNLVAASTFPSPFSQNRQRTLNFTLERFHSDDLEKVPMFIFGDLNFRLNTFDIVDILRKEVATSITNVKNGTTDKSATFDLVLEDKRFSISNHEQRFKHDWRWLRPYDFEATTFPTLTEFEVDFHPTYPFAEDHPGKFMKTRCPAWCDRVLFTQETKTIIADEPLPEYNLIGSRICMGDHKPVYLKFHLTESLAAPGHSKESESSKTPPGISLAPPSRSRLVSFLRDNLSFHHEPPKPPVTKATSLAPSSTSTASASSNSTFDTNCCFLKLRNHSGTGESQVLTKAKRKRGQKNILITAESSNPIGFEDPKCGNAPICSSDLKGSSSASGTTRAGRKSEDGNVTTGKCCHGCHIL